MSGDSVTCEVDTTSYMPGLRFTVWAYNAPHTTAAASATARAAPPERGERMIIPRGWAPVRAQAWGGIVAPLDSRALKCTMRACLCARTRTRAERRAPAAAAGRQ